MRARRFADKSKFDKKISCAGAGPEGLARRVLRNLPATMTALRRRDRTAASMTGAPPRKSAPGICQQDEPSSLAADRAGMPADQAQARARGDGGDVSAGFFLLEA